jgi:hypothetical protein
MMLVKGPHRSRGGPRDAGLGLWRFRPARTPCIRVTEGLVARLGQDTQWPVTKAPAAKVVETVDLEG